MQHSMALFIFFCFRQETHFLGKFDPKNQNFKFKLKFGTQAEFIGGVSVLYGKHPF